MKINEKSDVLVHKKKISLSQFYATLIFATCL
jgi:hypothetical protein